MSEHSHPVGGYDCVNLINRTGEIVQWCPLATETYVVWEPSADEGEAT